MSVDVKQTLESCLDSAGTSIAITPDKVKTAFGAVIGTAISEIFSGQIKVEGSAGSIIVNASSATATVKGSGSEAPLLSSFTVSATFTADASGVTMDFKGNFTSDYPVSQAWPSVLNEEPFTKLTLSNGSADLTVKPADKSFTLTLDATASYDGDPLTTGLFMAQYDGSSLGFLGGFVVQGTWSPSSSIPLLSGITIKGDAGLFVSQIVDDDPKTAFGSLNLVYLPDKIDKGLTFFAGISLSGASSPLKEISGFLPDSAVLDLQANLSPEKDITMTAELKEKTTQNSFAFDDLKLTWDEAASKISIDVTAQFDKQVKATGTLEFVYGDDPSLNGELEVDMSPPWKPFSGIDFGVKEVSMSLGLSAEGINLALGAIFVIGESPAVDFELAVGVLDFELPSFLEFEIKADSPGKAVTLPDFVGAFVPSIKSTLNNMPIIGGDNIKFTEIKVYACDDPTLIDGFTYEPGAGATGDIEFFDAFKLDFGFSFTTTPKPAIKAKGSLTNDTGGPIVIKAGNTQILKLSDSGGTKGPSACIDTTASGYCHIGPNAPANPYFVINAAIDLLGLTASVDAYADKDSFAFDVSLNTSNHWFTSELACAFDPSGGHFNAYADLGFNPPNITVPALHIIPGLPPIPSFQIRTPKIDFAIALGDQLPPIWPSTAPFPKPTKPDYFQLYFKFEFAGLDLSTHFDIEFSEADLKDPGTFIAGKIGEAVLNLLKDAWKDFVKVLVAVGHAVEEAAKWVYDQIAKGLGELYDDVYKVASEAWNDLKKICSVVEGNSALGSSDNSLNMSLASLAESDSAKGHVLLHHYYLNRDELAARLHPETPIGKQRALALRAVDPTDVGASMKHTMDALRSAVSEGSDQLKASAAEVLPLLEAHGTKSLPDFIRALDD